MTSVASSADAASLRRAAEAATQMAQNFAGYSRLAVTPAHAEFAQRLDSQWREVHAIGQALMSAGQAGPDQLSRLAGERLRLEHLLGNEVQPNAIADVERSEADIANGLRNARIWTLALLVGTICCALITSSVVGQAVLGTERALREREERLRLATGAAELGIWTWNPDMDRVRGENDLLYMILGLTASSPPLSSAQFVADFVHPEDRETFGLAIEEMLQKGARTVWEGRIHNTRGELRWIELTGQAVPGLQGTSRRVIGTVRDITARHQAADALYRNEQRFRALFYEGPIAIYSCDRSGVIVEFNQAAARLWQRTPKTGETCEQFAGYFDFYALDGTRMLNAPSSMKRAAHSNAAEPAHAEFFVERADGTRMTVVSHVVGLIDKHGELAGAINCCYETTERSRLERETQDQARVLADLHRRKDEFLAMLGHELRNPLAALSNAVQLLRLHKPEEPLQKQGRSIIERQVKQLKHLVDDLLEVSRITTGSVRLRQQQVNLRSVVERALETAQPVIAGQHHELTVALPAHPIYVHADGARLEQVLVNLLSNAAKYTEKGGRIALKVQEEGEDVTIRVRDNGIGIAADLLPHIFELFTQAERSLDRSQGGLGIGLSLVQRLVELHGGSVVAHSELGHGSEFVVRLPLMLAAVPTSPAPLPEAPDHSGGLHVLVVDDNVDAAESLAVLLEMTGHAVRLAYDGPSALQAVIAHRPDLVLLDIGLPGLDGFEVAQKIRRQASLSDIVLVALTGYGQDGDRQRALDVGFDYHLVKPADFGAIEQILATVREAGHQNSILPEASR